MEFEYDAHARLVRLGRFEIFAEKHPCIAREGRFSRQLEKAIDGEVSFNCGRWSVHLANRARVAKALEERLAQ